MFAKDKDTIVALSTPVGQGAIALIRVSGSDAINIVNKVFEGKDLNIQKSHTIHFGTIKDGEHLIDEVLVSLFKAPHSYTKENIVEISCHGSDFIIHKIIHLLIDAGCRLAEPGEFTMRAFLNGQLDLAQAEAVSDLIASQNEASHRIALQQMRGGFSNELKELRQELIDFAALVELELDFSEEDVEFANRDKMKELVRHIMQVIQRMISSFELGNALKNGIPVVIAGKPNVGKSTLLNALLNEDRAIVSDIPGTTRDTIEDEIKIKGITFRFVDTAGIRETEDYVESIGVKKTFEKIKQSALLIFMFDPAETNAEELHRHEAELMSLSGLGSDKIILLANKCDQHKKDDLKNKYADFFNILFISAREKKNLEELTETLLLKSRMNELDSNEFIVTNIRHVESLKATMEALEQVRYHLESSTLTDFLASDIKRALFHLGSITGEVSTDDLLGSIFSRFCIGK